MDRDELEETIADAEVFLIDEGDRSRRQADRREYRSNDRESVISDSDLASLRKRLPFLSDFSDEFIRSRPMESLLKIETTTLKIKQMEQGRDWDDRLAANKMSLEEASISIVAGLDNRWSILHPGRFLPGAACSANKLWLTARQHIGLNGSCPVGSYDMAAIGLGGYVTSRGWCELHNPSSSKLSLRMFSINNCGAKIAVEKSATPDVDGLSEIAELGELKLALRTLRCAASMVMPWNFAFMALENFLIQSNFCHNDVGSIDRQGIILMKFTDYVIKENSNKWRDCEPFLDASRLKGTWDSFWSAQPMATVSTKKCLQEAKQKGNMQSQQKRAVKHDRDWVDICFAWNVGKCLRPANMCFAARGTPLRHVCNFIANKSKPNEYCAKDHARVDFHK